MKHLSFFILFLIVTLCACTSPDGDFDNQPVKKDSSLLAEQPINSSLDSLSDDEYALSYVVCVAEGYNYDSLRSIAMSSSRLLNFRMDTLDKYDPIRRKIILPESSGDEIWANEYFLRRSGDSSVSIEMSSAYIDPETAKDEKKRNLFYSDTLKMFVFADLHSNRQDADRLVKTLKPAYPQSKIITTEIFMGCMH